MAGTPVYIFEREIAGKLGTATLSSPTVIRADALGNPIILDSGNNRVVKTSPDGEFLAEIGGFGFGREQFNDPTSIATADGINIYVLDSRNGRVVHLDSGLNWIKEVNLADIGPDTPVGRGGSLAINSFGDFYLSDPDNNRVLRLDPNFAYLSDLGDLGSFIQPGAIAVVASDEVLVIDDHRRRLFRFDSYDNYISVVAEDGFGDVRSVDMDQRGRVYLADSKDNMIRILAQDGTPVSSFGNIGSQQYRFRRLHSLCLSGRRLYASDFDSDRVLVFRLTE